MIQQFCYFLENILRFVYCGLIFFNSLWRKKYNDIEGKSTCTTLDLGGKIEVVTRAPLETREELSLAYTPGVAEPCLEIAKDYSKSFQLTRRGKWWQ